MSQQNNRINLSLTPAQIDEIRHAFKTLEAAFSFTIGLQVEERIALPKINDANRTFVMDSLSAMQTNAGFMPSYLSTEDLKNDIDLYNQLEEFVQRSNQLAEKLSDTQMLAGSEGYQSALVGYRLFEAATKAGMPGADAIYDMLKQRFAGQGGSSTTPTPA